MLGSLELLSERFDHHEESHLGAQIKGIGYWIQDPKDRGLIATAGYE